MPQDGLLLALAAPRGFAKSTICSLLVPLWSVVTNQKHFLVLISNTHSQAVKFLQAIRYEFETNDALKALDPSLTPNPDKWSDSDLELLRHGKPAHKLIALGAEAQLRGLKFLQYRPDLLIIDDGEDDEMVRSEERRKNYQWWLDHVVLKTEPSATVLMVGTVLHEACLLNRIVRQHEAPDQRLYGNWQRRIYRALEAEESTWPERQSTDSLLAERTRDPYGFATEKQNDPVAPDYCPFKPEYFREDRWYRQLPDALTISITLDPACTDKEYSDETAVCTAGWDAQGRLWVLNLLHGKYTNPSDIIELLLSEYLRWTSPALTQQHPGWSFYTVGIEKVAFQKFLIHLFQQACRDRDLHPFIKELKGDRDKTRRIWQLEPLFRENRIFLRPDLTDLEAQLKVFPNGAHDDQADALAYHLQLGLVLPEAPEAPVTEDRMTFQDYADLTDSVRAYRERYPDAHALPVWRGRDWTWN